MSGCRRRIPAVSHRYSESTTIIEWAANCDPPEWSESTASVLPETVDEEWEAAKVRREEAEAEEEEAEAAWGH
jgi:hypothetical protein